MFLLKLSGIQKKTFMIIMNIMRVFIKTLSYISTYQILTMKDAPSNILMVPNFMHLEFAYVIL